MKCPKCGYLGFESGDRCRNCGYEFSLSVAMSDPLDLPLDLGPDESRPPLDLDRIIGAPDGAAEDLPLFRLRSEWRAAASGRAEASAECGDDAPLDFGAAAAPRAARGQARRLRKCRGRGRAPTKTPSHADLLFETPPRQSTPHHRRRRRPARRLPHRQDAFSPASSTSRCFPRWMRPFCTSRFACLGSRPLKYSELPLLPLVAFLLLLNGGYFIAFTAVGGQSIGKMALGIKVISQEESAVPIGRATLRTLAYFVSALPLGAGFLPGSSAPIGSRCTIASPTRAWCVPRPPNASPCAV